MDRPKQPLYRKVNTRARGVHHRFGGDYRHERHLASDECDEGTAVGKSMHGTKQRGLDYTPLFKFLLSKVSEDWDSVHSEAVSRLESEEPIFWMVAIRESDRADFFASGESSYFSGLFVDEDNRLQLVNPEIGPETFRPTCKCCTHTINGIPFTNPWLPSQSDREFRLLAEMTRRL